MIDIRTKNGELNEKLDELAGMDPKLAKDFMQAEEIEAQYLIDTKKVINSYGQDR